MQNYNYPIDNDWSTEEIIIVIQFYNAVEAAYESGIDLNKFKVAYDAFKQVVPSKSEEKQLGNKFEDLSHYSIYRTVQEMRQKLKEKSTSKKAQLVKMSQ